MYNSPAWASAEVGGVTHHSVHPGMAAGFAHQELPEMIQPIHEVRLFLGHGLTIEIGQATENHSCRLARAMHVDRVYDVSKANHDFFSLHE